MAKAPTPEVYTIPEIAEGYRKVAKSKMRMLVPRLLADDRVEGIATYAANGAITLANVDSEFLQPAMKAKATACVAFLINWKHQNNPSDQIKRKRDEDWDL